MKTAWCGGCEIRNPTNTLFKASTASPYSTILNDLNEKILSNENNHKFKILESPYNERLLRTNKIRLLNVEHGVGTLRLHITSHKLRDDLDYDAISYVWGAKGTSTNVSLNTLNEENQPSFAGALDDQSVPHASRKYISSENYGDILRTRGHILDAISEVVEDANLVGRFDYMDSNDVSSRCLQNPVHAANVDHYTRSLHLACHTVYRTRDDIDTIPAEYLMALLCDTRVSRDATTAYKHAWSVFTDEEHHNFERVPTERRPQAIRFYDRLIELTGHSFFSTTGGRFGIATPGCKPGDKVCAFYGELPLHTLRWLEHEKNLGVIHGDEPAEFCGVAFIPHLMKPHEKEAARLGPDETFVIG
ncbi:hypothetical protein G6011_11318 [Alternaria panax]|uniref:Heterokaryon incompatibility domain-containing protein n=1 Tax=Alternaria panax TaxID=48097 RepID=A0AAD4IDN6_9PLEO|nr:hypothetical protein G6011_11318 [Alternaria panax]